MPSQIDRTLTAALSLLAVIGASAGTVSPGYVIPDTDPSPYAQQLVAQRREIEEIKQIFARIDRRIVQIEKFHREIEYILSNREAAESCLALEQLRHTRARIERDLGAAAAPAERARLQADKDHYAVVFRRAEAAFQRFDCRE